MESNLKSIEDMGITNFEGNKNLLKLTPSKQPQNYINLNKNKTSKFKFYWKSNQNPDDKIKESLWEPYDDKNQNLLNQEFLNLLNNQNTKIFRLLPPAHDYEIDLKNMQQYSILDSNKIRKIKVEQQPETSSVNAQNFQKPFLDKINLINLSENIKEKKADLESNENLQYKFFWKSNNDPYNKQEAEKWEPYDQNNQIQLNQDYFIFKKNENQANFNLKSPANNYGINFKTMFQYSLTDQNKQRKIKIENQINKKYSEDKEEEILFFWKSNSDPWNKNIEDIWTPYDMEDELILKNAYEKFLINNSNKTVDLKNLKDYYIDFSQMLQINKNDKYKSRPIQRNDPKKMKNVCRNNRFESEELIIKPDEQKSNDFTEHQIIENILNINCLNNKKYPVKSLRFCKIHFIINQEFKCELEIKEELGFTNGSTIKFTFNEIKNKIIQEISDFIKKELKLESSQIFVTKFQSLKSTKDLKNFFLIFMSFFLSDNCLLQIINNFFGNPLQSYIKNIKFFYICFLASYKYFNKKTNFEKHFIDDNKKELIVFRISPFLKELFQSYNSNSQTTNFIIYLDEFLFFNYDPQFKQNFLKKVDSNCNNILWEIKIPKQLIKFEKNQFAEICDSDKKEILIRNGGILNVEPIKPFLITIMVYIKNLITVIY